MHTLPVTLRLHAMTVRCLPYNIITRFPSSGYSPSCHTNRIIICSNTSIYCLNITAPAKCVREYIIHITPRFPLLRCRANVPEKFSVGGVIFSSFIKEATLFIQERVIYQINLLNYFDLNEKKKKTSLFVFM